MPKKNEKKRTFETLVESHVGLLLSGVLAFVVVYRLLMLSRWDTQTAAAILQHAGSGNVILGVVLSAAPALIGAVLWAASGAYFYVSARDGNWRRFRPYGYITLVPSLVALTIASTFQLLMMLVVWACFASVGRMDRSRDTTQATHENRRGLIGYFVSIAIATVVLSESSWLPREVVAPDSGVPFTGYVLKAEGPGELIVLRDDPRQVEFIEIDEEQARSLCASGGGWPGEWFWSRPADLWGMRTKAHYPTCP